MADTRAPAPGRLRLVEDFVNTVELDTGPDAIATPEGLEEWLADHGFPGRASAGDVAHAHTVREALRGLLEAHSGGPDDPAAAAALTTALAGTPMHVRFDAGQPQLVASRGALDACLAAICDAVLRAVADGTWPRLKACRSETCRWAFYDRSKNRSGAWCSMDVCGSRAKVRAYRERRGG